MGKTARPNYTKKIKQIAMLYFIDRGLSEINITFSKPDACYRHFCTGSDKAQVHSIPEVVIRWEEDTCAVERDLL